MNEANGETKSEPKPTPPPIKPRVSIERKRLEMIAKQQQQERLRQNSIPEDAVVNVNEKRCPFEPLTMHQRPSNKCGFLYKTGPSRKRFQRRWFVACDQMVNYFSEEPTRHAKASPKGTIALNDVLFVSIFIANEKSKHPPTRLQRSFSSKNCNQSRNSDPSIQYQLYFNIGVSSQQGRIYLFAADCVTDKQSWVRSIAERISPSTIGLLRNEYQVDCCGFLHVKLGISGIWTTCLVLLQDKYLTILTELQENQFEESKTIRVDLRKIMSISSTTAHQISSCGTVSEIGQPLCLNRPHDTTIYIQADYKSHTDIWYHLLLKSWTVPHNSTLEQQLLTPSNIPVAIDKCLNFISTYGGLTTKGIYRHADNDSSLVKSIVQALQDPVKLWEWHVRPEDGYTVEDIASALKLYLLSLNECILTKRLYPEFITNNKIERRDERLRRMKSMLKTLPSINFCTLKKLICHFCYLIENANLNEMNIANISLEMGPVLIFHHDVPPDTTSAMDILTDLISCYAWLFDVSSEEMEKERKIQRTLVSLRETRIRSSKPGGDILVGVFVYNKEWGKCLNVPLTPTMTAEELVLYTKDKCSLKEPPNRLSVFEVVCDGQMERILHYSEVVLSVILSWTTNWPPEDAKNNYLIIKTNELYDNLSPYLNQTNTRTSTIPLSLFSELKFSDANNGKTFRKVVVEFIGERLNIYKDAKADKVIGQWNIEDITWYMGSESKRNAPNKFSITFVDRYKPVIRSKESCGFIGRSICCSTDKEYYQWITGMILAEYPKGVFPPKKAPIDLLL